MATFTVIPHLIMLLDFDCVKYYQTCYYKPNELDILIDKTNYQHHPQQGKNKRHLLHRHLGHLSTTNASIVYSKCLCAPPYSLQSRWNQLFLHAPFFLLLFNILTKMPVASSSIHFLQQHIMGSIFRLQFKNWFSHLHITMSNSTSTKKSLPCSHMWFIGHPP